MVMSMQKILVLPRKHFRELDGFVSWPRVNKLIDSVADYINWLPRPEAERSEQWVQPIPCAIFRDSRGRYCVFRQARQQRSDLSLRYSFVVGGHIDGVVNGKNILEIFEETVKREVSEEIGLDLNCHLQPVGIVIDSSSVAASRHIGFIYEAIVDRELKSLNANEFSTRSKSNGQFSSIESLSELRSNFDPWSFMLFSQYMSGGFSMDVGRQPMLSILTE